MMTEEQKNNWFRYHEPTEETKPKYAAIRAAENECHAVTASLLVVVKHSTEDYNRVNDTLRTFAEVIDANAPDSVDKTAAIRCIRIARNCLNELVAASILGFPVRIRLGEEATKQLLFARFQANSAIACGGK